MRHLLSSLCLTALLAATAHAQTSMPRMDLTAGFYRINAEVAANQKNRMQGLMHRRAMQTNEGMLFVFEHPGVQCFWMKDTTLPLTAAFLADDGAIVNLVDMQPLDENSHCSSAPVRFVLEMHQGWFASKGLKAGSQLSGSIFNKKE